MTSKLAAMQARFQQKQMQEKEEKLLRLYENQQQRAFERVGRGSAGSNTSLGSTGGGKVRQLFEERRQKAGVDKSYPLEPINGKVAGNSVLKQIDNKQPVINNSRKTVQSTIQRSVTHVRNGKPLVNKRETVQRVYRKNNGLEKFEENHSTEDLLDEQSNLANIMAKNRLLDSLEDEISPPLEGEENEIYFAGKLANVGGQPPSYKLKTISPKIKPSEKRTHLLTEKTIRNSATKEEQILQKSKLKSESFQLDLLPKMATKSGSASRTPNTSSPSLKQPPPKAPAGAVVRDDLQECSVCGRRFAADRIKKHEEVCRRTTKKQRKTYDAVKHRVQGTDIEQFVVVGRKKGGKTSSKKPLATEKSKGDWRRAHEEFIATIKSAKMAQAHLAQGGKLSDLPPPPLSSNPDYVQCPHCKRKFNQTAADRHIPKCANYIFNKPKPGSKR